eukprot:CAMPEP_0182444616 /NCGR_PEP_ID=MMETSP1172-20130603/3015_1 /TAXON_ID=708627 /ORGANISM="Timspurckia oligopyrenoides, Strain CCMP3278" /LENGTH=353 /DNA_ID=CAMNT_0024640221 /DNA_START=154 /DNA_END=1215 /DNA_ORIENTATION=-
MTHHSRSRVCSRTNTSDTRKSTIRLLSSKVNQTTISKETTPISRIPSELISAIQEPAARSILENIHYISVDMNGTDLLTSYVDLSSSNTDPNLPPLIFLPGFDSSVLEFRRLAPLLQKTCKHRIILLDLIGLGFTERKLMKGVLDYGPNGKRLHIMNFIDALFEKNKDQKVILCGGSLGGSSAIDFTLENPDRVSKLILIDAQGFIDGNGSRFLFSPLDKLGAMVLKSVWLRNIANKIAYFDKKKYATLDAMNIGRLHCFCEFWEECTLEFIKSGGYKLSKYISQIDVPTLLLWGQQDEILSINYLDQFEKELCHLKENNQLEAHRIEKCGHVPHLEQSQYTADAILNFLTSQ